MKTFHVAVSALLFGSVKQAIGDEQIAATTPAAAAARLEDRNLRSSKIRLLNEPDIHNIFVNKKSERAQTMACTVILDSSLRPRDLQDEGSLHSDDDDRLVCAMDPVDVDGPTGFTLYPIEASLAQEQMMKSMVQSGELVSGHSTLLLQGSMIGAGELDEEVVFLPPDIEVSTGVENSQGQGFRHLAIVTGDKPILVVKVNALDHHVIDTAASISDVIFGTTSDEVSMKEQLYAISNGKLNITAGEIDSQHELAPGVIEVSIPIKLEGSCQETIVNAITAAVGDKLDISVPGPYQHVMYILQGCYSDGTAKCGTHWKAVCNWAAYAGVNSWYSVYQGGYHNIVSVLLHELGHNFDLGHSRGLDGSEYGDATCLVCSHFVFMWCLTHAQPFSRNNYIRVCCMFFFSRMGDVYNGYPVFNPAKNFQLGWYTENTIIITPSGDYSWSGSMIGIAEFANNTDEHPVIIKIETGTDTDQFIAFNRATGFNVDAYDKRAGDAVTMVEASRNGLGYSKSLLKAILKYDGDSYTYLNWADRGVDLVLTMVSRDLEVIPATTVISIQLLTQSPSASPSDQPSLGPIDQEPTTAPVPTPSTPTYPGSFCCSWNYKDCGDSEWCGANEENCGLCEGFWMDEDSVPTNCIAQWGDCTNDIEGCCTPGVCDDGNQWYRQCK